MKKLLKIVTEQLRQEFPCANPKLESYHGSLVTNNPWLRTTHGLISFTFIKDNKEITLKLVNASIENTKDTLKKDLKEIKANLIDAFINNLLYSTGPLNIINLLLGSDDPEDCMLI